MKQVLLLSSGGFRGFSMLGLLTRYKSELKDIQTYIGSSVGGVLCLLLSIGFSPEEIFVSFLTEFKRFSLVDDIYNFVESLFERAGYEPDITFGQLFERTKKRCILTAYDLSEKCPVYYDHITSPDKKVAIAMRETSNLNPWLSGYHFDGALCSPFPLQYCKRQNLGPVFGICAFTKNTRAFTEISKLDLISKLDVIFCRMVSMLYEYEIDYGQKDDTLLHIDQNIPIVLVSIDRNLMMDLFFQGAAGVDSTNILK